jgi:hypothetical protein
MDKKVEDLKNYTDYWELINAIAELCDEAMEDGNLYGEDVISALDRVKFHWTVDHIECRFGLIPTKDNEETEEPSN